MGNEQLILLAEDFRDGRIGTAHPDCDKSAQRLARGYLVLAARVEELEQADDPEVRKAWAGLHETVKELRRELAAARVRVEELEATNAMYEAMAKAIETELFGNDFGRSRDELVERADKVVELEAERQEHVRVASEEAPGNGVKAIATERQRQVEAEDFSPSHDAEHDDESLAFAAAMYATPSYAREGLRWPWSKGPGFKPGDRLRELAKAGALIAAEYDRLHALTREDSTESDPPASSSGCCAAARRETDTLREAHESALLMIGQLEQDVAREAQEKRAARGGVIDLEVACSRADKVRRDLEAVLMDANVTYGLVDEDESGSPMMVERAAIVKALGYEDESAWLARTAAINAPRGRVKNADLAPGERYFAVYTPTGVCCFKTRSEDEAREIVARSKKDLDYMAHIKPRPAAAAVPAEEGARQDA